MKKAGKTLIAASLAASCIVGAAYASGERVTIHEHMRNSSTKPAATHDRMASDTFRESYTVRTMTAGERDEVRSDSVKMEKRAMRDERMRARDHHRWNEYDRAFFRMHPSEYNFLRKAGYSDREIAGIAYISYRSGQPVTTVARLWSVTYTGDIFRASTELGVNPVHVNRAMERADEVSRMHREGMHHGTMRSEMNRDRGSMPR